MSFKDDRFPPCLYPFANPLLEAIARNNFITALELRRTELGVNSFSTFLRTTSSVTDLLLVDIKFEELLSPTEATQNLLTSIAQNNSIRRLHCSDLELRYQLAILRGSAKHTRIRAIKLHMRVMALEVASALQAVSTAITAL